MCASPTHDPQKASAQFFAMLQSVAQFDGIEIRGILNNLLSPTQREDCFLMIYHRAVANVASLQQLNHKQHFQAISMLTRSLFELAVDIRLIDALPDAIAKMLVFSEVEKLRCAKKILDFKASHPGASVDDSIYQSFVAAEEQKIQAKKDVLWPGQQQVEHWSGMKLWKRVKLLGSPFDETYHVEYPRLSWYVHAGLTGITNLKAETFLALCGVALKSSTDSYEQILLAVVDEFKIGKADQKIKDKLVAAKLLPFTNSKEEAELFFKATVG
jgi:hypothetical protein